MTKISSYAPDVVLRSGKRALGMRGLEMRDLIASPRHSRPVKFMLETLPQSKDNDGIMTNDEILASTADRYGLDPQEADLALRYAAASKEATQRDLTATPEEAARLKGMRRLASLKLDLYQRLQVAARLPRILVNERQYNCVNRLRATFNDLHELEKALFGEPRTERDDLVKKAGGQTTAWRRTHQEPETAATPRPNTIARKPTHLAA